MPSPAPLTDFQALGHPLGQQTDIMWTMPLVIPTTWNVIILRREGLAISDAEVAQYIAGVKFPDIEDFSLSSSDYQNDLEGFGDHGVENNLTYYYKGIIQDASDDAISTTVAADITPKKTVNVSIVDAKEHVLIAIERVLKSYGMIRDKHYQLLREYSLPTMKPPTIYVTRVGGQVLNQFIGHFRSLESSLKESYGELEMDNVQVIWEDPNPVRRDDMTNMFRESKEFIRAYLQHPDGGGVEFADILIEGDVINEAVRDRTQVGAMMMISCAISSTSEITPTLASWLDGLGEVQN